MAMSRKHYREAAEVVKHEVQMTSADDDETRSALHNVANGLAGMFKRDNSAFQREQFMDACGLGNPNGN